MSKSRTHYREVGENERQKKQSDVIIGIVNRLHSQAKIMNCTCLAQTIKQAKQENIPVKTQFSSLDSCSEFYCAKSTMSD